MKSIILTCSTKKAWTGICLSKRKIGAVNYSKHWNDQHFFRIPSSFPDEIAMDKSPRYFVTPQAPERIFRMNPRAKLILSVCEPVRRTLSDYVHEKDEALTRWGWKNYPHFERFLLDSNGQVNARCHTLAILRTGLLSGASKHLF